MTYVVGVNYLEYSSIICDNRITYRDGLGENTALKSGVLFPGCIFGFSANNVEVARDFILSAKYHVGESRSISELWTSFVFFVKDYSFSQSKDDWFEIILSTRALGKPRLFRVNPSTRLTFVESKLVTTGSGKDILSR